MRKILRRLLAVSVGVAIVGLAISFFFIAPIRAQETGPIYCSQYLAVFPTTATTTKVVPQAAVGNSPIYVCGFDTQATGGTGQLVYGTGGTCGTGTTAISPLYATAVVGADHSSHFRGLVVPAGNDICYTTGASTTAAQAFVFFRYKE